MAAASLHVQWHHSTALGTYSPGALARRRAPPRRRSRLLLPGPGPAKRSPNRPWRRWGTDRLVPLLLSVRERLPARPSGCGAFMAVADPRWPHGGDFGPQFGYIGHASHQNGLDADVYYPRADGKRAGAGWGPARDRPRALSQELVDRFLAAGAALIFVGPNTGLGGPPGAGRAAGATTTTTCTCGCRSRIVLS